MPEQSFEEIARFNNVENAFAVYNGIRAVEVRADYALAELTVNDNSLNPGGMVHGGASYSLCDCAAGLAARSVGGRYVTLNADFHYYRPVTGGVLRAEGRVTHRGRTTVVVQADALLEDGTVAAGGTFTMYCIKPPENTSAN